MAVRKNQRAGARAQFTLNVVLLSPAGRELAVLLERRQNGRTRDRWALPADTPRRAESLHQTAARISRSVLGNDPSWLAQLGTFGVAGRTATTAALSIAYLGVVPGGTLIPVGGSLAWFTASQIPSMAPPQGEIVAAALRGARERMDLEPVAFHLLPGTFTLSELQSVYEMLLGRRVHKASFRRALQAAWLVRPVDEWRSEGRGRPAQLYRYAPRKRRSSRRSLRFDLLV